MNKRISNVISVVFMSALICSCGGISLRPDVAMEAVDRNRQLQYFTEYEQTDEIIDVDSGSINPGYSYTGDSFELDGYTYFLILPKAVYMDGHRQDAVANLDDGEHEMTAYEYDYPDGIHILNVSDFLYCREDELEELYEFYSDPDECGFTYQFIYMVPDRHDRLIDEVFEDMEFDDELFIDLANASADVCEEVSSVTRRTKILSIRQYTVDTNFTRTLEFYRDDGNIYMNVFNNMNAAGVEMDVYTCYRITDEDLIGFINSKLDECNDIIRDDYGHEAEEY